MKTAYLRFPVLLACLLVGSLAVVGCGKKPKSEEPTTTSTPPPPEESTPPPPPPTETTTPEATVFDLTDIYFAFDDYSLSGDAKNTLSENARLLKDNMQTQVLIEGHCDERGTVEYNLALGERRAHAARTYLENLGISPERLSTISYGKERPVDPGHSEEAWAKNRRAHFVKQ